jgi:hypothetical protein
MVIVCPAWVKRPKFRVHLSKHYYRRSEAVTVKLLQRGFLLFIGILAFLIWHTQPGYGQGSGLVISQVGLSQAQGTTYVTIILNNAEQPKITPVADRQSPQLLIDFPRARVSNVPLVQSGDQQLVKRVRTSSLPGGNGVRIILDLVPGRPYSYWRSNRAARGGYQYMVGITPDSRTSTTSSANYPAATSTPETPQASAPASTYDSERESTASTEAGGSSYGENSRYSGSSEYQRPTSGEMGEIARQLPAAAGPVLGFLEQQGWSVQRDAASRGGPSQKYILASSRYPNLSVKVEHIPTKAAGSQSINVIALSTDNLKDSDADKYREMKRWDMATIKKHYEDIGDYYEDGLKPYRIRLRERSKAVVLRDYDFYQKFLEAAVPQNPGLAEKIKKHAQEKANKRLEGSQYTESENPLVIMDMVDFYTLRVYFIGR